jgi:hypothetical protein
MRGSCMWITTRSCSRTGRRCWPRTAIPRLCRRMGGTLRASSRRPRSGRPAIFRSHEEVTELFKGWRPLQPGIVRPWEWPQEDTASPRTAFLWGGVAVKDDDAIQ